MTNGLWRRLDCSIRNTDENHTKSNHSSQRQHPLWAVRYSLATKIPSPVSATFLSTHSGSVLFVAPNVYTLFIRRQRVLCWSVILSIIRVCGYPINSGTRCSGRVGFWSSFEIIGYPQWSGIRPQLRIPVAASDIRINQVCDATRAFDVIGYLLQLSGNSSDDWQSEKFGKFVSTENL